MNSFNAKVMIHPDQRLGEVHSRLHGFLTEHAGESIYEGIWTLGNTNYAKHPGLRTQVIQPLRQLRPGIVQWPGGQFANYYQWEDGIGLPASRPASENLIWSGDETNQFGTDEFNRFCNKLNAEPHHCLNIATATPRDAVHWLEYCNSSDRSRFGRMRSRASHPEPYLVNYWTVGYEPWERGGFLTTEDYAAEFRRYAGLMKQIDNDLHMIACGSVDTQWNEALLASLSSTPHLFDSLSMSTSFSSELAGGSLPSNEADFYALFAYLPMLEDRILQTIKMLDRNSSNSRIGLGLSEWGIQHPEAKKENALLQPSTMRDALMAACTLHLLYRYAKRIQFAQIAYPVNGLQCLVRIHKEMMFFTPTYYVFNMLMAHIGKQGIGTMVASPKLTLKNPRGTCHMSRIHAFSSVNDEGNRLVVTLINVDMEDEAIVSIYLKGDRAVEGADVKVLYADSPLEENELTAPTRIEPYESVMDRIDNPSVKILPPASVTRLILSLR